MCQDPVAAQHFGVDIFADIDAYKRFCSAKCPTETHLGASGDREIDMYAVNRETAIVMMYGFSGVEHPVEQDVFLRAQYPVADFDADTAAIDVESEFIVAYDFDFWIRSVQAAGKCQ